MPAQETLPKEDRLLFVTRRALDEGVEILVGGRLVTVLINQIGAHNVVLNVYAAPDVKLRRIEKPA